MSARITAPLAATAAARPASPRPAASPRRSRAPAIARLAAIRLAQAVPTLLLVVLVNFTLLSLAPGDMAQVLAGEAGGATPEFLARLRTEFGLDEPAWQRLLRYYGRVLQLDLGYSYRNGMAVSTLIAERIPATLLLSGAALVIAVVLGVGGGFLASLKPGGVLDRLLSWTALVLYATPGFLLGLAFIIFFGVYLEWLPIGGMRGNEPSHGLLANAAQALTHLLLPALTLGLFFAATKFRITRSAMREVRGQDYVRTARAKGVHPLRVASRHVLRNALLPVVTIVGMQAGALLGGAVLVEVVFAWPGLGRLAFEAVFQRDFNLLSGVVLCAATGVLLVNIVVDVLYSLLDPRINLQ